MTEVDEHYISDYIALSRKYGAQFESKNFLIDSIARQVLELSAKVRDLEQKIRNTA